MSENENDTNADKIRHLLTLNEIFTTLGVGTYNTIKKIVLAMNLNKGNVIRNGRSFDAYYISGNDLNFILKHFQNKNGLIASERALERSYREAMNDIVHRGTENASENEINVKKSNEPSSDKIIELMDIKHKLEAENMTLTKELSEIRVNYAKVEAGFNKLGSTLAYDCLWSSSEYSSSIAWAFCTEASEPSYNEKSGGDGYWTVACMLTIR